jgi:hypothetical protein
MSNEELGTKAVKESIRETKVFFVSVLVIAAIMLLIVIHL